MAARSTWRMRHPDAHRTQPGGRPMGSTIDLKAADGFTLSAYTAGPAGGTKGLVVIQEIFGVNHHMRDMCDRFAAEGYAVCAPALFDRVEKGVELGYTQDDIAKGRDYRMKLDDAQGHGGRRGGGQSPRRQEARHRRLLLRRHGRLVGRDAHQQVCGVILLVRRRHRRHQGRAAELPGADAFRRDRRVDPDDRRGGRSAPRSRRWRPTSTWAPATASAATSAAASASRTTSWRSSARWRSSPGTWAD